MIRPLSVVFILLFAILPFIHGNEGLQIVLTSPPPTAKKAKIVVSTAPTVAVIAGLTPQGGSFGTKTFPPTQPPTGVGGNGAPCNIFEQDCRDDFKCVAGNLNSVPRCRRRADNEITVGSQDCQNFENGGDNCDKDGMCVGGTCWPICRGDPANPECNDDEVCHIYPKGATLCEKRCHPLNNECLDEQYCSMDVPAGTGTGSFHEFSCLLRPEIIPIEPHIPLGRDGDSCVFTSQCEEGWVCIRKSSLGDFCKDTTGNSLNCCTRIAEDVDNCPEGFELVPFFANPPPQLAGLGICVYVIFN